MREFSIGAAARRTGIKVPTIRYYEQIGLVEPSGRNAGNQRLYDHEAVRRLGFVKHARALGFGLPEIRQLLELSGRPEQSCEQVDAIARSHLQAIDNRLRQLRALKEELQHMIGSCANGSVADCRIIETLADHDK